MFRTMIFITILLPFLLSTSTAYGQTQTNITLPFPHIIIVGPTGSGKSSLAMALIGEDVECENCTFPICYDSDSCTKETSYATAHWLGNPDNQNFSVVDTPGFGDSDDEMDELLEEMIKVLNEDVKSANAIVLTMDSLQCRWTSALTEMLEQLESLFGRKVWNNTIIEMSKFSYDEDDIEEREYECEHHPERCHDESYWYNEMNRQLEERFHIGFELPIVFIDSWSQKEINRDEPSEQDHFKNETKKLWDFAMSHDAFNFKSIDQVLEENEAMRNEIDWLNEIITQNITELQGNMTALLDKLVQETVERKMNDDTLSDATTELSTKLEDEMKSRAETDSQLQENIDINYNTITEEMDKMNLMPIGSIVAWVIKPNKDAKNATDLPEGWIRCDGTTIPQPSIWAGSLTPDLNGKKRFLRGGSDAEYLDTEDDQIQDLELSINDPGHSHTEGGHNHNSIADQYYWGDYWCGHDYYYAEPSNYTAWHYWLCNSQNDGNWYQTAQRSVSTQHLTINNAQTSLSVETSDYRRGSETRPVNTKVIWIIRVW